MWQEREDENLDNLDRPRTCFSALHLMTSLHHDICSPNIMQSLQVWRIQVNLQLTPAWSLHDARMVLAADLRPLTLFMMSQRKGHVQKEIQIIWTTWPPRSQLSAGTVCDLQNIRVGYIPKYYAGLASSIRPGVLYRSKVMLWKERRKNIKI